MRLGARVAADAWVVVPTHRDHPWERDARVGGRERPPLVGVAVSRTRWWAWAVLVVIAALVMVSTGSPSPGAPRNAARFVCRGVVAPTAPVGRAGVAIAAGGRAKTSVWGSASAPPGATVRVHVRVSGQQAEIARRVCVGADGLFEAIVRVPRLDGRTARSAGRTRAVGEGFRAAGTQQTCSVKAYRSSPARGKERPAYFSACSSV